MWVISFTPQPLYPLENRPQVHNGQEAAWASELVWMLWTGEDYYYYYYYYYLLKLQMGF
jgi:hypothetical protein